MAENPWNAIAKSLGHAAAADMWRDMYVTQGMSIDSLARRFAVSGFLIRKQLKAAEIPLRKRGGRTWSKVEMSAALAEKVKKDGVRHVAEQLGVDYTTVRKAYFKWKKAQESSEQSPEPTTPESSRPTGAEDHE